MGSAPEPAADVFAARSSRTAWISSLVLIAFLAGLGALILEYTPLGRDRLIAVAIPAVFCLVVLFFASIAPTMKYVVREDGITASCGPFHWLIPIGSIDSIVERDLEWLPWSDGWKLPGYALFTIQYGDAGRVRMCGTSLCTRIVLIRAGATAWGFTPADIDGFVAAVKRRQGS